MENSRLWKDMEFIVELDKMKSIFRETSIIGEDRREDDAQHSWHISLMAVILAEYSDEKIELLKVIKMLLIHDLVEIFAGDTFCYDEKGNEDKRERELEAAEKIFGMLDEDKGRELRALWDEFEEIETPEAKFATAMDRFQPMLSNYHNNGGTWKKYGIKQSDIYKRIEPVQQTSQEIWKYVEYIIEDAFDKGLIKER